MRPWRTRTLAVLGGCLALGGCATLNEAECLQGDWRTIGFEDGARGQPLNRIGEHRKACAEYGVRPDLASYETGHWEGARVFCVPRTAYRLGVGGGTYHGTCPPDREREFVAYFQAGREVRALRAELRDAQGVLTEIRAELTRTDDALANREAMLVAGGLTRAQRIALINEIRALSETRVALESAIGGQREVIAQLAEQVARRELSF